MFKLEHSKKNETLIFNQYKDYNLVRQNLAQSKVSRTIKLIFHVRLFWLAYQLIIRITDMEANKNIFSMTGVKHQSCKTV